jgi:hypothetical protein
VCLPRCFLVFVCSVLGQSGRGSARFLFYSGVQFFSPRTIRELYPRITNCRVLLLQPTFSPNKGKLSVPFYFLWRKVLEETSINSQAVLYSFTPTLLGVCLVLGLLSTRALYACPCTFLRRTANTRKEKYRCRCWFPPRCALKSQKCKSSSHP